MLQVAFKLFGCIPGHVGLRGRVEAVGEGRDTVKVRGAPGAAARRARRHALAASQCWARAGLGPDPCSPCGTPCALPWRVRAGHCASARPAPASRQARFSWKQTPGPQVTQRRKSPRRRQHGTLGPAPGPLRAAGARAARPGAAHRPAQRGAAGHHIPGRARAPRPRLARLALCIRARRVSRRRRCAADRASRLACQVETRLRCPSWRADSRQAAGTVQHRIPAACACLPASSPLLTALSGLSAATEWLHGAAWRLSDSLLALARAGAANGASLRCVGLCLALFNEHNMYPSL